MAVEDAMAILRVYLAANTGIIAQVSDRIYCPRLPENATLPAISFFRIGGISTPYIPPLVTPSVQFDCWAESSITEHGNIIANRVYRAVYDALQGIQNVPVSFGGKTYYIKSAQEETGPQDVPDVDIPERFRTIASFSVMMTVE